MSLNISPSLTRVPEDLLDELTGWPAGERAGLFRRFHQGAFSLVQLAVIAILEAQGPLSMSRLAESLDVSVASATGIIDRMEHRGLVARRHEEDDRRIVIVSLTDAGTGVFREIAAHRRERMAALLERLTEDELGAFVTGVRAMRAARTRLDAEPEAATGRGEGCGPGETADAAVAGREPARSDEPARPAGESDE